MTIRPIMAVAALGLALVVAGCTAEDTVLGHKVRATAQSVQQTTATGTDVLAGAPRSTRDGWQQYLGRVQGRFGIFALDRNTGSSAYVYCIAADCNRWRSASARANVEVHYKHGALKACRELVREHYPGERPDCAIFAINDKIVWEGDYPWEAATATQRREPPAMEPHRLTLSWAGSAETYSGSVNVWRREGVRRYFGLLSGHSCGGSLYYEAARSGEWSLMCPGLTAEGEFTATDAPDGGARGTGVDSRGRTVEFVLDPASG